MEEAGWIRPQWVTKENGWRTPIYELGASGKKQLQAEESRWRTVTAAVDRLRTGLICRFSRLSGEGDRSGVLALPPLAILILRSLPRCRLSFGQYESARQPSCGRSDFAVWYDHLIL